MNHGGRREGKRCIGDVARLLHENHAVGSALQVTVAIVVASPFGWSENHAAIVTPNVRSLHTAAATG